MQPGFLDSGASATVNELVPALNKALAMADPQQASVILSHLLEKEKQLTVQQRQIGRAHV